MQEYNKCGFAIRATHDALCMKSYEVPAEPCSAAGMTPVDLAAACRHTT